MCVRSVTDLDYSGLRLLLSDAYYVCPIQRRRPCWFSFSPLVARHRTSVIQSGNILNKANPSDTDSPLTPYRYTSLRREISPNAA